MSIEKESAARIGNRQRRMVPPPAYTDLRARNPVAWSEWINGSAPSLKRHAYSRLDNPDDVHEVIQETWTRVYKYFDRLPQDGLNRYVHAILRNVVNQRASRPEERVVFVELEKDDEGRVIYPAVAPNNTEGEALIDPSLQELLANVEPEHRKHLLDIANDLSVAQIAKRDGIPNKVVSQLRFKAVTALRTLLAERAREEGDFSSLVTMTEEREMGKTERRRQRDAEKKDEVAERRQMLKGKTVEEKVEAFRANNISKRSQDTEDRLVALLRFKLTDSSLTHEDIAAVLGCSKLRVQNDIGRLINLGYLEPAKRGAKKRSLPNEAVA